MQREKKCWTPIYCYALTGQPIWTFKDEKVLRKPVGIALDKNRNVYVAGRSTNNVVVLSPDGSNCREILTRNDMCVEFSPGILTRSINLPLGSKYTM
jgi:sugar lactone lactonase YvrE